MYLISSKKLPSIQKPIIDDSNKTAPFWLQIMMSIGLEIGSTLIQYLASFVVGPIGGVIVRTLTDIGSNMLLDYLSGYEPLDTVNLLTSIVLPLTQLPSKAFTASKFKKNKFSTFQRLVDNSDDSSLLKKMAKDLHEISFETNDPKILERKYQQIIQKYDSKELIAFFGNKNNFEKNSNDYLLAMQQDALSKTKIDKVNKTIRKINKTVAMIDPVFATKELVNFLTRPIKKKINKSISKFIKSSRKQFNILFRQAKKQISRSIIPLNHTTAPWITGIKLFPIPGALNYFHVKVYFQPSLTNKKEPVMLYNKNWNFIKSFIDSPSAGQFYINNISWGWDIGKAIRNSNLIYAKPLVNSFLPYASKYISTSIAIARNVQYLVRQFSNIESILQKWTDPSSYTTGVTRGLSQGVKGMGLVNVTVKSIQSQNTISLQRYVGGKVRSNTRKKIKKISRVNLERKKYGFNFN